MGMDVYGKKPENERGEYFRNNVWWWHPLWDYCLTQHPEPAAKVEHGHSNSGDGLNSQDAKKLGMLLKQDLLSGKVDAYEDMYKKEQDALPEQDCVICNATGIRNDEYVQGTCNACSGKGKTEHFAKNYPFAKKNVEDFSEFLINSGGFEIC